MAPPKPFAVAAFPVIVNNLTSLVMLPLLGVAAVKLQAMYMSGELLQFMDLVVNTSRPMNVGLVSMVAVVAVVAVLKCMFSRPSCPVYLVDFAVHKGLDEWKFSKDLFIPMSAQTGRFTDEELDFQKKILYRSGLGDETYVPPCECRCLCPASLPARAYWAASQAMSSLWSKTSTFSPACVSKAFVAVLTHTRKPRFNALLVVTASSSMQTTRSNRSAARQTTGTTCTTLLQGCTPSPSSSTMHMPARSLRSLASQLSRTC
eukprot:GHRQ01025822.1.p1 GENE.GHRQ01025822.1~~GHRQ01025822.1.p1  ORF type:complete len:261 (+),score=32.01 GHRQ01025822.1:406-1188(+)